MDGRTERGTHRQASLHALGKARAHLSSRLCSKSRACCNVGEGWRRVGRACRSFSDHMRRRSPPASVIERHMKSTSVSCPYMKGWEATKQSKA